MSWFSFEQIICFPKPWKKFSVLNFLTHLTNISARMVSEKPFLNVQLGKSILSHFVSLSPALFSFFFFLLFFFNLLNFFSLHRFWLNIFSHEGLSKNWRDENTPYRCRQTIEFNKSFFKSILYQFIRSKHKTSSFFFFPAKREENYCIIVIWNRIMYDNFTVESYIHCSENIGWKLWFTMLPVRF